METKELNKMSNIWLSSLVPVIGFTLSTLSLKFVRNIWEKKNKDWKIFKNLLLNNKITVIMIKNKREENIMNMIISLCTMNNRHQVWRENHPYLLVM